MASFVISLGFEPRTHIAYFQLFKNLNNISAPIFSKNK